MIYAKEVSFPRLLFLALSFPVFFSFGIGLPCSLSLSEFNGYHTWLNGYYAIAPESFQGRPHYLGPSGVHLFYYTEKLRWSIAEVLGSDTVFAYALEDAPTPDQLTAMWNEVVFGEVIPLPTARATCAGMPASLILLLTLYLSVP